MNTLLATSKRPKKNDDSLIPLINIVFLLLIFFMIAGQISSDQGLTIEPPISQSEKALVTPALEIVLDREKNIYIDGIAFNLSELDNYLTHYVDKHSKESIELALKADKSFTAGKLTDVLNSIRSSGISAVTLYTLNNEKSQ